MTTKASNDNYINYKERKNVHFTLQAVHMSSLTKHREVKSCSKFKHETHKYLIFVQKDADIK